MEHPERKRVAIGMVGDQVPAVEGRAHRDRDPHRYNRTNGDTRTSRQRAASRVVADLLGHVTVGFRRETYVHPDEDDAPLPVAQIDSLIGIG